MLSVYSTLFLTFTLSFNVLAQQLCNGHAEYCDRIYSNVSQVGTHDSAFVGILPVDNQEKSVTDQLNAGIRFLQGQTHNNVFETFSMCHTSCWEEDSGTVVDYLGQIKAWLDGNPNEVLTLLLTNGDYLDMSVFDGAFTSSGLKDYAFLPTPDGSTLSINAWPTLATMISSDKRIVIATDYDANPAVYPYILDEFSYFFETPYDTLDPNFAECTLDRPPNSTPDGKMYIVNHFLDVSIASINIPDMMALATTNAATGTGSIGDQVGLCEQGYGRPPKFVLVDYFDVGDVFTAERSMNGV